MIDILSFSEKMPAPKTHRFTRQKYGYNLKNKKTKKLNAQNQPNLKKKKRIEKKYFLRIFIILSFKILNMNKKVFGLYH